MKRFQHIVKENRRTRRTRERSRTKSEAKEFDDPSGLEQGVNERHIVVLSDGRRTRPEDSLSPGEKASALVEPESDSSSPLETERSGSPDRRKEPEFAETHFGLPPGLRQNAGLHRDITFSDEVLSPSSQRSELERLPGPRSTDLHIAFLERQRNPTHKTALRIPGPRDFERGLVPVVVPESEEDEDLPKQSTGHRQTEKNSLSSGESSEPAHELNGDDYPVKRNITINEPDHHGGHGRATTSSNFDTGHSDGQESGGRENFASTLRQRARTRTFRTFNSVRTARDEEKDKDLTPYLSWAPTVGRNSAFYGLTEAQREELGGIEYRALKTLAIILVCKS